MSYAFEDIKDQVVIITGSGRGIGKSMAELFVEQGAKVVVSDIDEAVCNETADELGKKGDVIGVVCDITKKEQCDALVKAAVEKWGKLDCLINNAGITKDGLFMRMKPEQWHFIIDVNLNGTFYMAQAAVLAMRKAKSGTIINLTSLARVGNPGQTNYSAAKAGVEGFTKALSREVNPMGIRVNAVAPGFVETRLTDAIPDKIKDQMVKNIPMGRTGVPEDIAKVALFLASDLSSYVSGQIIDVNGGLTMF